MERTPHALLVGSGATAFAAKQGVPILRAEDLVTAAARKEWEEMATFPQAVTTLFNEKVLKMVGMKGRSTSRALVYIIHSHAS